MLAATLSLLGHASALRIVPRASPLRACASSTSGEPLQLAAARSMLLAALEGVPADDAVAEVSGIIQEIYEQKIAPVEPAIWTPDFAQRQDAIIELSLGLDALEEQVKGPLLTGRQVTSADGLLYPSFVLYFNALPQHYGWTEWTSEALFYKRPRLHAWYELMGYERRMPASAAEESVRSLVSELSFEWAQPVPTLSHRGVPAEYE
eukprot:scaffold12924_cov125-Isochrysis_galbana.AAC.10